MPLVLIGTHILAFADRDTVVAQDVIGSSHMEEELRQTVVE